MSKREWDWKDIAGITLRKNGGEMLEEK